MSNSVSDKNDNNQINSHELRRKIIRIAKELFLNPTEKQVNPKSEAPSKKEIISKLTENERIYLDNNPDIVFPIDMPERLIWDILEKGDMEKRREILLRVVAEDNAFIKEKEIVSRQPDENKILPSRKQVLEELSEDERNILIQYSDPILSTTKSWRELGYHDRLYFLENGTLPVQQLVQAEIQDIYVKYVNEQKDIFIIYLDFLNRLLCQLKKYREVKDTTAMTARIKGSDSALVNDSQKALNDIWGVEIIYANDLEKSKIEKIVSSTINIYEEKEKNKSNGYRAYHISGNPTDLNKKFEETKLYKVITDLYKNKEYYLNLIYYVGKYWNTYKSEMIKKLKALWYKYDNNDSQDIDIDEVLNNLMIYVEIQSKTFENFMNATHGSAAHYRYEALDKKDKNLPKEEIERIVEEFKKYIQEKYTNIIEMNDGRLPSSMLPTMREYLLDGTARILSPMETLKHIYPFFIDPHDLEIPEELKEKDEKTI